MSYIQEVKGVTFYQILSYFGYSEFYRTTYYIQYTNPLKPDARQYVLFTNYELENALCVLDLFSSTLVSKFDLILFHSPIFDIDSIVDEIGLCSNKELNLIDAASEDEIIKRIFDFNVLDTNCPYLNNYNIKSFLHNGRFLNLYQDRKQNLIIPLFDDNAVVNFYTVNSKGESKIQLPSRGGFYISEITGSEDNIAISFEFDDVMNFFQEVFFDQYITIIPNRNVDYKLVSNILYSLDDALTKMDFPLIQRIVLLYNSGNLNSMISMLHYVIYYCAIKSPFKMFINYSEGSEIVIKIYPPDSVKPLSVIGLFANLNEDVFQRLNITKEEKEERLDMMKYAFNSSPSPKKEVSKMQYISFIPKVELIEIFINKLIEFVFEGQSGVVITNVNKPSIDGEEEFTSLF